MKNKQNERNEQQERHKPSGSRALPQVLRYTALAALATFLVGCGGGSGSPSTAASVDLNATNRDAASHAAAASVLALGTATAIPLLGSGSAPAAGASAQALRAAPTGSASGGWMGRVMQALQLAAGLAAGARMQAQAVSGPVVQPCMVSGSVAVTVDDKDGSGTPSAGDVLDIVFSACRDSTFEVLDGRVTVSYTQITQSATPSVSARLVLQQLSDTAVNHALTLDGAVLLDYSVASSAVETLTLTADGAVVASVTTHVFTDTVTLSSGFREQTVYDPAALPPTGSTQLGRTVSTVSGILSSSALAGRVAVVTLDGAPLVQYGAEPYPRSGAVQIDGRTGRILVTALSAGEARLDLDAGSDGSFESSSTVSWDWLL